MRMSRDDLNHKPVIAIDLALRNRDIAAQVRKDVEAYLAKGGKIQQIETGVIANICLVTKKPYNPSIFDGKGIKRL